MIQLWKQLIWWVPAPFQAGTDTSFPAPSCSWLRAHGPVSYHDALHDKDYPGAGKILQDLDLEPTAEIESAEAETLPGAIGVRGLLILSGQCFPYHLTPNDLKKTVFKSWNAAKLKLNIGKWMLDQAVELPLDIFCVIIAEKKVAKMLVCLCLVPDEEQEQKWRRVGLCHWDGLIGGVARYAGDEPSKGTFIIV